MMLYTQTDYLETMSVIPDKMAIAPPHPLENNLELPLPSPGQASMEEIRAKQLRDRIPGVVKRLIPFDAETTWEYWWAVPGRLLLPEDVELLEGDRDRVEGIIAQLIWLLGGYYFDASSPRQGDIDPLYDWQQIVQSARKLGFETYFLDIDYLPRAIKPYLQQPETLNGEEIDCIAVEPAHWHIEFFQLQPVKGGCEIQEPKKLCSCQIWMGKPFLRYRQSAESSIRYDLWVGKPLDITIPPWRSSANALPH